MRQERGEPFGCKGLHGFRIDRVEQIFHDGGGRLEWARAIVIAKKMSRPIDDLLLRRGIGDTVLVPCREHFLPHDRENAGPLLIRESRRFKGSDDCSPNRGADPAPAPLQLRRADCGIIRADVLNEGVCKGIGGGHEIPCHIDCIHWLCTP